MLTSQDLSEVTTHLSQKQSFSNWLLLHGNCTLSSQRKLLCQSIWTFLPRGRLCSRYSSFFLVCWLVLILWLVPQETHFQTFCHCEMQLIKYHFMSVIWPESPKGCLLLGERPLMTLLFWIKNHALGWYSQRVWQNLCCIYCVK